MVNVKTQIYHVPRLDLLVVRMAGQMREVLVASDKMMYDALSLVNAMCRMTVGTII